ncbi:MAG: glycosyltransferase [Sphingomonadales bacterium]
MRDAASAKLDILFVLDNLTGGGAERAAVILANGLLERGHNVGMVLFRDHGVLRDRVAPGVAVSHLGAARARQALWPLSRRIAALRPQVIVSFLPHANILAILAAQLSGVGCSVVVTEHNQPDETGAAWMSPGFRRSYRLAGLVYRLASAVVCCSPGVREAWAARDAVRADRLHAVFNPVIGPGLEAASREAPSHPWAADGGPPLVVAACRLEPEKDLATLLRAFARLRAGRPARLLLLGEGSERPSLLALAERLGVAADIAMPGFCANPFAVFRGADVLAMASLTEGFPTVMVEALACGLPVVMTDSLAPADRRIAGSWVHATVPVGDDAALAAAIAGALDDPADRAALPGRVAGLTLAASLDAYEAVLRRTLRSGGRQAMSGEAVQAG